MARRYFVSAAKRTVGEHTVGGRRIAGGKAVRCKAGGFGVVDVLAAGRIDQGLRLLRIDERLGGVDVGWIID